MGQKTAEKLFKLVCNKHTGLIREKSTIQICVYHLSQNRNIVRVKQKTTITTTKNTNVRR